MQYVLYNYRYVIEHEIRNNQFSALRNFNEGTELTAKQFEFS